MRTSPERSLVQAHAAGLPVHVFESASHDIPDILRSTVKRLTKYDYAIDGDRLIVPIARNHLSSAGILIDEVRKNPELKSHILFHDGKDQRTFDDVVWDMEKNPRLLTHMIDQEQGFVQPVRVLITPKIKGAGEGNVINAADIKYKDAPLENLTLATRLYTQFNGEAATDRNAARLIGQRLIVQTDRILITGIDEMRMDDEKPTITMHIIAEQPCMRAYNASQPIPAGYDRRI